MIVICKTCTNDFETKAVKAIYCAPCRVEAKRLVSEKWRKKNKKKIAEDQKTRKKSYQPDPVMSSGYF